MYFYEIGYHSMEECPTISLCHEEQFTKDEFQEMSASCYANAWKKSKWREYNSNQNDDFDKMNISCDDLLSEASNLMVSDYNFQLVTYNQRFSPFGWASVEDKDDWSNETSRDNELILIREKVSQIKKSEDRENRLGKILD
ncbi:MAG: hypothetical protein SLAVMIC_00181 [uncultured marine phage]|uniref:Uncharacterized protein n=1 Tax=uncultured marine phage TaxID=707152 RepID=A0A8D9CBN1_9VIRU|nr:MAG: hypothetical protein SLAVMIC_00181 [uncultured marine phage]